MSKTQYFTAMSIDGFIADPENSLDWLFEAHTPEQGENRWEDLIGAVGAMVMGATTYEWVLEHERLLDEPQKWREFYNDIPCWVFTHRELPPVPGADINFVQNSVAVVHQAMAAAAGGKTSGSSGEGNWWGSSTTRGCSMRSRCVSRR